MNTEIQTQSETVSESEALVLREDNEGLVTLTLNRPRQFNALSEEVLAALQEELDRIAEDQQARLVVIAGNGNCLLYTSPSPRDRQKTRMPSSA